ncbi:hypothetical protein SESBI_00512 [Sesbania bispinosa]|nr:hypothetical protein SESBI_00512 [Sesbania bispinosa]
MSDVHREPEQRRIREPVIRWPCVAVDVRRIAEKSRGARWEEGMNELEALVNPNCVC